MNRPIPKLLLLISCIILSFCAGCDKKTDHPEKENKEEKEKQVQKETVANPDEDLRRYTHACPGVIWDVKFRFKLFDKVSGEDLIFQGNPKYSSSQIKIEDMNGKKQALYIIENSTGKYFEINVLPGYMPVQTKYVLTIEGLPPVNIEVTTVKDTSVVCPIYHVVTAKYKNIEVNNLKGQILKLQL